MADILIGAALTGFATGVGVVIANWVGEKYIKPKLDKTHDKLHKKTQEEK